MFEAMAAAVPVVVAVDGEARTLVEKAEAGVTVEPENPRAIADGIQRLYQDEHLRKKLGLNGQRYVMEHYDREKIALYLERLLLEVHCFQPAITKRSPVTARMNHGLVKSFINRINRQKAE
jgi:glycosyltransferase involved in cell wall biosynthesis